MKRFSTRLAVTFLVLFILFVTVFVINRFVSISNQKYQEDVSSLQIFSSSFQRMQQDYANYLVAFNIEHSYLFKSYAVDVKKDFKHLEHMHIYKKNKEVVHNIEAMKLQLETFFVASDSLISVDIDTLIANQLKEYFSLENDSLPFHFLVTEQELKATYIKSTVANNGLKLSQNITNVNKNMKSIMSVLENQKTELDIQTNILNNIVSGIIFILFAVVSFSGYFTFRKMEKEREIREKDLDKAQRLAKIGSWKWQIDNNTFVLSDQLCHIFGISNRKVFPVKDLVKQIIHPDDRSYFIRAYAKFVKYGADKKLIYRIIQPSGDVRWVESTLPQVEEDTAGAKISAFGTIQDITERVLAEEKLHNLQNYLSSIIDSMPSMLVGVDSNGDITQWNMESERQTGFSKEDAIGIPLQSVIPTLISELELIETSIETGEKQTVSNRMSKVDGKEKYEDITIYPLVTSGEKGAVFIIDDVTEEFLLQQQLNQSRRMDAVGQLVGGVAHDFNNMLGGIITSTHLLKMMNEFDTESAEFLEIIETASFRASELISQLLLFSRKKSGEFTSIQIRSVIKDSRLLLQRSLDKKVKLDIVEHAENDVVEGDASQIQNSIMNMCINASHAMESGGNITIETRNTFLDENFCGASPFDIVPNEYVEIEIRDDGSGMSEDIVAKIFEPFFTTKEQGKGTGLGLAAVYGIVKNHKGAINVYSEVGVGTVFHIYLPVIDSHIEEEKALVLIKGTGTILLVDDEEMIRKTISGFLKSLGYDVLIAENGEEAVKQYTENQERISLILLDMIMPIMNGKEAFEKIKEIDKDAKIIVSSGFSKEEDIEEMQEKGLCGFIRKPYRMEHLSEIIAENIS